MAGDYSAYLDEATLAWLLEEENPSVRSLVLANLLKLKPREIANSEAAIMESGAVPLILEAQNPGGWWSSEKGFYTDKYRGTVWQLLILAELGADGSDERIRRACEFILYRSQERESLGFAINESAKLGGGRKSEVIPCLTGNLVWSLVRLGLAEDPRTRGGIEWILKYQRCDDGGGEPPSGWPYDRFEPCWGRHSCHMGVVKCLKALAAIPEPLVTKGIRAKRAELAEFMLAHRVHKKSRDPTKVAKPGWLKPGFPLMYQTDILEILGILIELGFRDERMGEAIAILRGKGGPGRPWKMENSFNGKTIVDIEREGEASKWITYKAVRILSTWDGA